MKEQSRVWPCRWLTLCGSKAYVTVASPHRKEGSRTLGVDRTGVSFCSAEIGKTGESRGQDRGEERRGERGGNENREVGSGHGRQM